MKLRALALLLVLANLGFYIWSQGWLDGITGVRATGDREPERSARQFQPQVLRVLPGAQGAAAMAGNAMPGAAGRCLEAGPFTPAEANAALAQWRERGVQTANFVPREQAEGMLMLRVDSADAALAAQLTPAAGEAAAPFGKAFAPCAK
ncbi:MAG: hypothetical protein KDG44_05100 [Burkholderiaceae bacterium]|nr:hypothetical protein [Burkholderiaceae bacterium]